MQYSNTKIPAGGLKFIDMENSKSTVESLYERMKDYVETRIELVKLRAIDKSSSVISIVITYLVVFIIFGVVFLFLNIGLALLIGTLLGHFYFGFFILAALYALVGIILIKFRNKWVRAPLINMMVKGMHE